MFREIADLIIERGSKLPVRQEIGDDESAYLLRRKIIPRNPILSLYLHNIKRSDDPTPHDHRSFTISLILRGGYVEQEFDRDRLVRQRWRGAGSLIFRSPWASHRLVMPDRPREETWTLFLTGPTLRTWGFWCPWGWRPHYEFTAGTNTGRAGRGCG